MKRIILTATAFTLALVLCACNGGGNTDTTPTSSTPTQAATGESTQAPTSEPAQVQDGRGDIIDDKPMDDGRGDVFDDQIPAGANDVIMQGVFYYELPETSGDYGEGLSTREGAELVNDLLTDIGLYSGNEISAGQCVYITFDGLAILDSAMGRECYMYSVAIGTAEAGFMGHDYYVIYRMSVDYSGNKTAAIYEDFSNGYSDDIIGSDPGDGEYYEPNDDGRNGDGRGDFIGSEPVDTDVPNWWGEFKGEGFSVGFTNFDGTSFWFTFYNLRNGQSFFEGVAVLYPDNEFMAEHGDISFYLYEDFNTVDLFASESSEWAHLRGQYERID